MKAIFARFGPLPIALAVGLAAAALTFFTFTRTDIVSTTLPYRLELKVLDAMFLTRGRVDVEPQVVIAGGDTKTLARDEFGVWGSWDRRVFAQVVQNLIDAGADVVGFDMVWADPAGISPYYAKKLGKYVGDSELSARLGEACQIPEKCAAVGEGVAGLEELIGDALSGTAKLGDALDEHSSRLVLGFIVKPDRPRAGDLSYQFREKRFQAIYDFLYEDYGFRLKELRSQEAAAAGAEAVTIQLDTDHGRKVSDLRYVEEVEGGFDVPLEDYLWVSENIGSFSAYADPDGVMRALPLVYRYQEKLIPSLALSVAALHYGASPLFIADESVPEGLSKIVFPADEGRTIALPVDHKGRVQVNFLGPSRPYSEDDPPDERGVFHHISLADIYDNEFDKEAVKGKIVLVAVTAIGTYDQRVTPYTPIAPGVEVHAAAIQSMVTGDALVRNRDFMAVELLLGLVLALMLGFAVPRMPIWSGVVLAVALSAGWAVAGYSLFLGNMWFHQIPLQGQIWLTWAGITVYGYLTEGREKALLKKEFSTVLAPTVVDQLLKNPDLAGLGGDERNLTVMFSDIRGFTSMSEKMSPEGLTQFLNEYLTPMTDILIERQGTLDKYMGDAIMAFWGAPIAQPDHAERACLAALDMLEGLEKLKTKWRAEGKPSIDVGIGMNTGLMRVGFMGSERMRNYTLLGDNVNLGARLEGINKTYRTNIIVSEMTYEAAKGAVYGRVVDAVRVKGKREPVTIYELRGRRAPAGEEAVFLERFAEALGLYRDQQFQKAKDLFVELAEAGDRTSEVYIERCDHFLQSPPPADWDGVYEMTTK